jgi:flagellar basal-body rod protein FlgB
MTEGVEGITASVLSLALDAAVLRQQAIASNIANANTAGYVRQTVSFDRQLEALGAGRSDQARLARFAHARLRIEPVSPNVSGPVRLDVEVAQMAQNSVHYQTLLKGIERQYAILSTAISDGKK